MNKYLEKISDKDPEIHDQYLTKQAILEHLAVAAGAHVAQNLAADKVIKSDRYKRELAHHIVAGARGEYPGPAGYASKAHKAFERAVVPELGIIKDEGHHLGNKVKQVVDDRGAFSSPMQNKRQIAGLLRDLRKKDPKMHQAIRQARRDEFSITAPAKRRDIIGKTAINTAIGAADPTVAVMNATKMVASTPYVKETAFGKKMQEIFVKNPFKKGMDAGAGNQKGPLHSLRVALQGPVPSLARKAGSLIR